MKKAKILYVSQEITPFLPDSEISTQSRTLPQKANENGREIRVFMPRFGNINERRHQLHEVIRLSGMNLIINDSDHPLIIKVASIPTARMQVYFIDNEEYFQRKATTHDKDGKFYEDNDERAVFFCKGVLETVKKLGWTPDIIHCHGWMTAPMSLYLKKVYHDDPHFLDTKVIYSVFNTDMEEKLSSDLISKLKFDNINENDVAELKDNTIKSLNLVGAKFADGVVLAGEEIPSDIVKYVNSLDKPILTPENADSFFEVSNEFYDSILEETEVLAG